jgi:DNA-binding transcriptional MerR regulator/mannose-6-phosphate isomerase-like protein (cupin superfamily)
MTGAGLRVSEAARLAGVSPSTVRAWESSGLIAPRRSGRFRTFSDRDVRALQQIASLRSRGFNAAAIRSMRLAEQPASTPEPSLGEKLRAARRRRGLSLREAAQAAGLSVSHLSAIECGTRNASLAGLQRLAVALGIGVATLFGGQQHPPRRLMPAADRPVLDAGDHRIKVESLAAGARLLEPHLYSVEPGGGSEGAYHHEGEEMVYVLAGHVEFWLNEVERHVVGAGDCLTFPSTLAHRWRNCGTGRLTMLWVNTPITF